MRMSRLHPHDREGIMRYRRHVGLARKVYDAISPRLKTDPKKREDFVEKTIRGYEINYQRNMAYIESIVNSRLIGMQELEGLA